MVYLIVCDKMQVCKIGYSICPEQRLSGVQTGYPHRLRIYKVLNAGSIELNKRLEKSLHRRFKDIRLNGEWFTLSNDITRLFNGYKAIAFNPIPNESDLFVGEKHVGDVDWEYIPSGAAACLYQYD